MTTTTHRPISIALSASAMGHVALGLALMLLIGFEIDSGLSPRPLLVKIERPESDGSLDSVANKNPIPVENPGTPPRPIQQAQQSQVLPDAVIADMPAPAMTKIEQRQSQNPPRGSVIEETTPDTGKIVEQAVPVQPVTVLTTRANSPSSVLPSTEVTGSSLLTMPMSDRQKKMLSKRVEKWASGLHKLEQDSLTEEWRHKDQHYTAIVTRMSSENDMAMDHLHIKVSTIENGETVSAELRMKRLAFSNFSQFVNRWDDRVQLHDDVLDGRFHSNSEINIFSTRDVKPVFHGKVTVASAGINISNSRGRARRDSVFQGGLETGVKSILLPKRFVPFPVNSSINDEQVRYFDSDTRIQFYRDGTYGWHAKGDSRAEQRQPLGEKTFYLVAAKKQSLFVKGVVNGKVLVYSPEKIVIEDDLVYAVNPTTTGADDYLGLVSDKSIEIAPPEVTGPGDLTVHAAMYAKRRFNVKRFRARENARLLIHGSLTAGALSATEPRFRTRMQFDQRLDDVRPPGFPLTNRYEAEPWESSWHSQ